MTTMNKEGEYFSHVLVLIEVQSNLYKSATFGSGLNWLLYTGVCLIKVESEMS